MDVKSTLAHGLQKSVAVLLKDNDLCDFTVVVDGTSFQCHRPILRACSGFFQGLFGSEMKECRENLVKIKGMTASTFDVILNSVYRGVDGLTVDNVLDVWSGTEQLQIRYLTEECKNFAIENVSVYNCCDIFCQARLYLAENVESNSLNFMSKHFDQVRNTEVFLELLFPDFYRVIKCYYLITSSEDLLVETVLKWVDYSQHHSPNSTSNSKKPDKQNHLLAGYNNNVQIDNSALPTPVTAECDANNCNTTMNQTNNATDNSGGNIAGHTQETSINIVCASESQMDTNNGQSTLTGTEIDQTGKLSESGNDSENSKSAQPVPGHCQTVNQNLREDRKQHLFTLMSACRLCLISSSCLDNLLHSPALLSCKEALNLVTEAMMYKLCVERRHETWPEAATHRVTSHMKHVMVFMSNNKILAYNLISGSVSGFADLPADYHSNSAITVFDNVLYIGYENYGIKATFSMFAKNKSWKVVNNIELNYLDCKLLAHGEYIYFMADSGLCQCNCQYGCFSNWYRLFDLDIHGEVMVFFKQYILIMYTGDSSSVWVLKYNTKTKEMHKSPSSMDGTSKGMITFIHLGDVFLLQKNGSLWKICSTDKDSVDFELVCKLWDKDIDLKGSVVYRRELFVFYNEINPTGETYLDSVPELFRKIKLVPVKSDSSCVPMVLRKSWLIVKDSKA